VLKIIKIKLMPKYFYHKSNCFSLRNKLVSNVNNE
jgi:hypothetical protein